MSDVENSFPPIASGKLFPWYLCLMYVYAFGEKHFCMFNANKVFVFVFVLFCSFMLSNLIAEKIIGQSLSQSVELLTLDCKVVGLNLTRGPVLCP